MVLAGAVSFGILSSFVKLAYGQGYTAAELSLIQALIGAGSLWCLSILSGKFTTSPRNIPMLLFSGASIGISTFLYYLSVKFIPASISIVLLMQFTWLSILIEWVFFGRKPLLQELVVTSLILGGTVLASGITDVSGIDLSPKGVGIVLLASLIYAIYIVTNSRAGKNMPWQNKSAWIMTGSALSIFVVNFNTIFSEIHLDLGLVQWGAFLGLFGTILPPVLFAVGIPKVGASTSGLLMTVELPVAIVSARLILKEQITATQVVGILVMIAAIISMNIAKQRKAVKGALRSNSNFRHHIQQK